MNDEDALKLLGEVLENTREISISKPSFFGIYSGFVDGLISASNHIQNDNFRACTIHFHLLRTILEAFLNYTFKNQVFEELKGSLEGEENLREEIILNIASLSLSIGVLSDSEERDIVNIETLQKDFEENLKNVDDSTKVLVLLRVSNAIREVLASFTEGVQEEMSEFYDKQIESSKKGWEEVFNALREYLIRWDKKANIWKR